MIKRNNFLLWLLLIGLFSGAPSCSKHNDNTGCITRVQPRLTDAILSPLALDTIRTLFLTNNLPLFSSVQFTLLYTDISKDSNNQPITTQQINGRRYINGLTVYYGYLHYIFVNGKFAVMDNEGDSGTPQNADTSGHLSLDYLRKTYLQFNPDLADSCLTATLCYIDASRILDRTLPFGKTLMRVWAVSPEKYIFPLVFVSDDTGKGYPDIVETISD